VSRGVLAEEIDGGERDLGGAAAARARAQKLGQKELGRRER
jgi:hypothetical protein